MFDLIFRRPSDGRAVSCTFSATQFHGPENARDYPINDKLWRHLNAAFPGCYVLYIHDRSGKRGRAIPGRLSKKDHPGFDTVYAYALRLKSDPTFRKLAFAHFQERYPRDYAEEDTAETAMVELEPIS